MEEDNDVKPVVDKKKQTLILVGFILIAVLVIFVAAGLYFSRSGTKLFQPPPTQTIVRNTPTMIVLPTLTPTLTPTPVPYEQLIPEGWVQFKSKMVEIWLPSSFRSMDIKKFTAQAEAEAEKAGTKLGEGQGTLDLILLDDAQRQSLTSVAVYISYNPLTHETLDEYVDAFHAQRSDVYRTVEQKKTRIGELDAIRELIELSYQSKQINMVVYTIQNGDTVWHVEYTCHITDFFERLPDFERSIQTFRVVQ